MKIGKATNFHVLFGFNKATCWRDGEFWRSSLHLILPNKLKSAKLEISFMNFLAANTSTIHNAPHCIDYW